MRRRPAGARRALRRRPLRSPRARPGGRALASGASSTPAAARPGGASCASSPRWRPPSRASPCWRAPAPARCGAPDGRCRGLICDDGRTDRRARRRARHRRRGRAVGAHHQPARLAGRRPAARACRRRRAGRPRAAAVPSHRRDRRAPAVRASSSPRRSAARARPCTTATASGSWTSWRRATRSRGRSRRCWRSPASDRSASTCARSTRRHFPNVVTALREAGLDPTRELIPVAPAAHYMMGGIVTDLHARSTLPGLYAVGESSCTGLHGANRLASNSLSECFVFARRAILHALAEPAPAAAPPGAKELAALRALRSPPIAEPATRAALWQRRRHRPHRRGPLRAARGPPPAGAADRPLRARAHRESRRPPAARPPRARPLARPSPCARSGRAGDRLADLGLIDPLGTRSNPCSAVRTHIRTP